VAQMSGEGCGMSTTRDVRSDPGDLIPTWRRDSYLAMGPCQMRDLAAAPTVRTGPLALAVYRETTDAARSLRGKEARVWLGSPSKPRLMMPTPRA